MKAADPFTGSSNGGGVVRGRGGFLRDNGGEGAPYVSHPTKTAKHTGNKADLIALCAERGIAVPAKVTVDQLHELLGRRPARVKYGSPSGFGGMIEDPYSLAKYTERYIVEGIGIDAELQAMCRNLAAMGREHPQFNSTADGIVAKAREAANHMLAADRGTHMHAVTDDIDLGRDWLHRADEGQLLGLSLDVQTGLAAAWRDCMARHGIEMLAVEASCVDDAWHLAGTLDRIVRLTRPLTFALDGGELVVLDADTVRLGDTKTGHPRRLKHAIQIASYAQSLPYDLDTETRGEWPWPIAQDYGLIFHLDVASALEGRYRCDLVLVDLAAGREHGGATVIAAREWAARSDIFSVGQLVDATIATAGASSPAVATEVEPAAALAPDPPRAAPDATPSDHAVDTAAGSTTITHDLVCPNCGASASLPLGLMCNDHRPVPIAPAELSRAPQADTPAVPDALTSVEQQQAGAAATAPAPNSLRAAQLTRQRQITEADARRRLHDTPEEGDMSDDRSFAVLRRHYDDLTDPQRQWIAALGRDAADAKVSFSSKETKTARRYEILRGLTVLAGRDESDEQVRDWLALVDPRIAQLGSVPLGHIVGSLSATEAATFARLVTDELHVVIDDNGVAKLVAA